MPRFLSCFAEARARLEAFLESFFIQELCGAWSENELASPPDVFLRTTHDTLNFVRHHIACSFAYTPRQNTVGDASAVCGVAGRLRLVPLKIYTRTHPRTPTPPAAPAPPQPVPVAAVERRDPTRHHNVRARLWRRWVGAVARRARATRLLPQLRARRGPAAVPLGAHKTAHSVSIAAAPPSPVAAPPAPPSSASIAAAPPPSVALTLSTYGAIVSSSRMVKPPLGPT